VSDDSALIDLARRIPGALGTLAARGHAKAALALIDAFGGTHIDISRRAEGTSLAERIGLPAAAALIDLMERAPCRLRIPSKTCLKERRAGAVLDAIAAGKTNTIIARELGVTDTYVARLRKEGGLPPPKRGDDRQLDLF
jgi:hypothetical protein